MSSYSSAEFESFDLDLSTLDVSKSVTIHGVKSKLSTGISTSLPPLLCLHGYPQTHHMWHKVAPSLAKQFQVIATDLRGYGESSKPEDDGSHEVHSKRVVARDQIQVMKKLGYEKFYVLSHDRGARVATRMAMDYPDTVIKLVVLDIVPAFLMYDLGNSHWASWYWHWFFLTQPKPIPENFINGSPDTYKSLLPSIFSPSALASYHKNFEDPACVHAMCEDYRSSAPGGGPVPEGPDYKADKADFEDKENGKRIKCDIMVICGEKGAIMKFWDVKKEWKKICTGEVTSRSVKTGHYIPEEMEPEELVVQIFKFFKV